jgi:HD superfamily phosphodiesterase
LSEIPAIDLIGRVARIRVPDTVIAREAFEWVALNSSPMLLNHAMRSYYFGCLMAGSGTRDDEVTFLAAVLHDIGLTEAARGPRRFEIEGADAAREFLSSRRFDERRGWLV